MLTKNGVVVGFWNYSKQHISKTKRATSRALKATVNEILEEFKGALEVFKDTGETIESATADGEPVYYGFYKEQLSMDTIDFETIKDEANELATTNVNFVATASSDAATNG